MVNNESFIDRFLTTFTFRAIITKFVIGTLIVVAFDFEGLRVNVDKGLMNANGFLESTIAFFIAIYHSYGTALGTALATIYPAFQDLISGTREIIPVGAWGSMTLLILLISALIVQYYSLTGLLIYSNIPDMSKFVTFWLSIFITFILIIIASIVASTIFGVDATLFTTPITDNVNQVITNSTINQSQIPIIDMMG